MNADSQLQETRPQEEEPQRREAAGWKAGNRIRLLENGEEFFPRVFAAIAGARREILIETFILFEDKVGTALQQALIAAGRRGVEVHVTVDGYGSPDLSSKFIEALTDAGVSLHVFDPRPRLLGMRTNVFRRLHRKLVAIDGYLAFVGGINFSADHLGDYGPGAKQDYAVEVEGPVAADIHRFARDALEAVGGRWRWWWSRVNASPDGAQALLVTRDNGDHRTDIESHYRAAIRRAREELIIANAYFFPGYRLLRDLRNAARRGVDVRLILQGQPDMPIAQFGARTLYDYLLDAGVQIYEYCQRPLHGKVAVADGDWATVGSSNLDPLSLSLNLEANLMIRDRRFNSELRERLQRLIECDCREVKPEHVPRRTLGRMMLALVVFHFLRRFPAWAGWLPAHTPRVASVPAASEELEQRIS